ncbi:phBC6A51 family helix-turn-helix protein [Mesobacillus zeae]|uniref:Homeodomain phBC6A51-type domain-containing protein n=1 Tax=Mesobacillus zeae TaxID=1917180 RepID=A0A398BFC3_9BACI|nr:phBC6A51 family helix-turn-helix protein [Mesobacillus zeae]RID88955.1 hypothetical protein D1970_00190 [Mesobacillus zeae]
MAKRILNEKQWAAITILSQPKRAGMTYEEVAKEVGVAKSTLFEWKKLDEFNDAIKNAVVRNTTDRLPDMFDSMIDNIIETGNAAAFRTVVQLHGMLTEKVEVASKGDAADIDSMRAEIERIRGGERSDT